jgi:small subunit ribosomal protein S10e
MLMPKKNRTAIFEYLFTEGVMVAEKNYDVVNHSKIAVPNLHVIKAMQSLTSKGLVTERFAWNHFYWYLNNDGTQYLRDYLHLPSEIVPATYKKPTKPDSARLKKSKILKIKFF